MKSKLIWDDWNINHIKKHQVSKKEVEEIYESKSIKKQTHLDRILILGKTQEGRLLTIVISDDKIKGSYVVSARNMSRKERRYYNEQTEIN